jgi:molybdenum cofactor biosynthesis enzyme MoaA
VSQERLGKMTTSLEKIGFYTLSDDRAKNVSVNSPLWRAELILTDACNFKCTYCRGVKKELSGTLPLEKAKETVQFWLNEGLRNVRFSGGEPTLYKGLVELVSMCKSGGVERIAISTNGSMPREKYQALLDAGVNDFSVSLDACCASLGDKMAGGIEGAWDKVIESIKWLSTQTYVTVGIVLTEDNVDDLAGTVQFAHDLGVADIRIISAAQYNRVLAGALAIPEYILNAHPILKYRVNNIKSGRNVRGIRDEDSSKCAIVLDDMAVVSEYHFPCIIYLREQGQPIGKVGPNMRAEREAWFNNHDCKKDDICRNQCLDVCVDHNNKHRALK